MIKQFIKVRWQFEGFHKWNKAPEEVKFLRNLHRHLFICTAKIEVDHGDRELEFFIVQKRLRNKFKNNKYSYRSCEMIAVDILRECKKFVNNRVIEIEVSEDGENSAIVEFFP